MMQDNNRDPPGPTFFYPWEVLSLKKIKLKETGVKPRAVKSKTPIPRAAMKNLWLKSRNKTARSIRDAPFHQEEQTDNQAPDQMVDITVKAPAEAVYRAGKKLAQDAAHKFKERRETIKTAQAVREEASSGNSSPPAGEHMATPDETPTASPNRSVRERQSHHTLSHTSSENFTPGKASANAASPSGTALPRQRASTGTASPQKAGNTGLGRMGQIPKPKTIKAPRRDIKTASHRVKSARQAGKTIKTARPPLSVSRSLTRRSVRNSRLAAQQGAQAAGASARGAKALGKAAVTAVRGTAATLKSAAALLLSGGWAAVLMVLLICLIGLVVGSCFGIFFSGEDTGTGQTIRTAIAQVNQEYQERLEELQASHPHDILKITGSQAVWKEVLAVYAVKTTTDPEGQDVASMDEEKLGLLAEVFWEMNQVSARVETRTETSEGEGGAAVEAEITVLVISVSHKTAQEMAEQLGFDADQKEQLQELLSPEYDDLWNELLYGIALASGNGDLVAIAQSQVGNVGGAPYWSWYGFNSRVEWCAIFVSWCADQCGLLDSGAMPKFSGCGTGMQWFQSRGQWLPGSATPEPGMLIFFKWYGSDATIADHVGIVERVENGRIYTIEGNSNDMVRRNSYPVGYGEIVGYGAPMNRKSTLGER